MAYMNQERKAKLSPAIKAACKKYGVKASLGVRHHSTLVINIKQSKLDFIGNYNAAQDARAAGPRRYAEKTLDVNPYWYKDHFTGKVLAFLTALFEAANDGNHDNSDIQSDYFDVGWYVDVNVGRWDAPYALVK
jgi:hypothetical protein